MIEEQLKKEIQYNLDYLEGNIDFELEYKELVESYSKLYEELEAKSKMLVNRDKELILFSDEIERLNNIINEAKNYCEGVIQEHENGEYDVDTVWLAIKEHKGNIKSVLNILNGDLENYWRGDKE